MKITESKLRQMIRGVIREFTGTAGAAGAKPAGYKSADTKSKESTYDTKKSDYDTKKTDWDTKKASLDSFDTSQKYRKSEEVKFWEKQDPVEKFPQWLISAGIINQKELDEVKQKVKEEIQDSVDFATSSENPEKSEINEDIYEKRD